MKFQWCRKVWTVVLSLHISCLTATVFAVSEGIFEVDSEFGLGTITRDSNTGLDWLDVSFTQFRSYNDIVAETAPGGAFQGFRHATLVISTPVVNSASPGSLCRLSSG